MWRALGLTIALLSMAVPAFAEPQLTDNLTVCRERQGERPNVRMGVL